MAATNVALFPFLVDPKAKDQFWLNRPGFAGGWFV